MTRFKHRPYRKSDILNLINTSFANLVIFKESLSTNSSNKNCILLRNFYIFYLTDLHIINIAQSIFFNRIARLGSMATLFEGHK